MKLLSRVWRAHVGSPLSSSSRCVVVKAESRLSSQGDVGSFFEQRFPTERCK